MDNELANRMSKLRELIRGLKSNQVIGGDSWVMYRTKLVIYGLPPSSTYQVDFQPDTAGSFVARGYNVPPSDEVFGFFASQLDIDPNYDGRWYVHNNSGDTVVDTAVLIYSTKQGRIVANRIKPVATA